MLFANVDPSATRKPSATSVVGSPIPKIRAEFDAIKRFEGLAKGIRFRPKELSKTTSKSMSEVICEVPVFL